MIFVDYFVDWDLSIMGTMF